MKPVVARLVVFGAAVGSLALLAGAVMLVLRLAQPIEYPVDRSRDPDGEIIGRVAKAEPGAILLTSEPSGSGVVPVVVTKETRIMLGAIEGWMNDVRAGGQIKVVYDLYEGKKLARVVEVLPEQGARPAAIPPTVAAPAVHTPAPQPEAPAPRPKPEAPRVAQPMAPMPAPAPPAPAVATPPAGPTPPPVVPAPPAVVTPPPAPVAPAADPPRPAPPAPTPEPDTTDGSAAVDWFLKGRR